MKAPDEFKDKMTAPNELWLTASLSRSRRLLGSTCPRLGDGTQASAREIGLKRPRLLQLRAEPNLIPPGS
jgi:hypothetical protein